MLPKRAAIVGFSAPRRRLSAFARDRRGVTAIEFGLLALPFFAIICAILQTALLFLAGQLLDSAVQDASRQIRTGQAQHTSGFDITAFRNNICNGLGGIFNCSNLLINVQPVVSFATATAISPTTNTDPATWKVFQPGGGSQVVLVQVYYRWPIVLNFGGLTLSGPDGTHLLSAVRVFKNEPFTS